MTSRTMRRVFKALQMFLMLCLVGKVGLELAQSVSVYETVNVTIVGDTTGHNVPMIAGNFGEISYGSMLRCVKQLPGAC